MDEADQGDDAARPARRVALVGQGRGRARDDRRPRAERPVAGLRAGQRALAGTHGPAPLAGVEHLVSTVEGELRPEVGLAALLAATFPGGSVTGAPKIAAVDLIASLEPVGRGASMGGLGRVHGNGDLELALTIRTFAIADGLVHLWVGGGIVWDSDPRAEVEESLTKAAPLLDAIGAPLERRRRAGMPTVGRRWRRPLAAAISGRGVVDVADAVVACDDDGFARGRAAFETLRVYAGRPFRLAQHVDRLRASAERLGLPVPPAGDVRALAEQAVEAGGAPNAVPRLYWTPGARCRPLRDRARVGRSRVDRGGSARAASGSSP